MMLSLAVVACSELKRAPDLAGDSAPATPAPATPAPDVESPETEPATSAKESSKKQRAGSTGENDSGVDVADASDAGDPYAEYDKADRLCDALCGWRKRCDGTGAYAMTTCLMACGAQWNKRSAHLGEGFVQYTEGCFPSLACSGVADDCLSNFNALPRPVNADPAEKCLALRKRCGVPSTSECNQLLWYDEDAQRHALACSAVVCDDAEPCLAAARGEVKDIDAP